VNIVFAISSLGGGGAERVAVVLANEWARTGEQVHVALTSRRNVPCPYELSESVSVVWLAAGGASPVSRIAALRALIASTRADVVVSFMTDANCIALLAAAGTGVPVVLSERTSVRDWPLQPALKLLRMILYPFASGLVVQTAENAAHCRRLWPSLDVAVIPNPVSDHARARDRVVAESASPNLLVMGRLIPEKQVDHVIRAFAYSRRVVRDARLVLVGDGPELPNLRRLVESLCLVDGVEFAGWRSDTTSFVASSRAFVSASRVEGFPNALLECVVSGLPAIAYDCRTGPAEILNDGGGVLVALNDVSALQRAMMRVLRDDVWVREMSLRGFGSAERFEPAYLARKWLDVFGAKRAGWRQF
jgi:GalNAc-alpha-(1->4)-GalNAc-alpha-(1->3)-diNAcBac-PP-undecaprenol alpha-1,4-N-acetyl-D-galactosaminyltransferase